MTIRLQALALVVILSAGCALADLATWTNTTNESATWTSAAYTLHSICLVAEKAGMILLVR